MPLVRAPTPAPADPPPAEADAVLREQLATGDAGQRRHAARLLADDPSAAALLATRLQHEADPAVQDALFASLVAIGGPAVAELLAPLLRSEDAALRGFTIEALKQLGDSAAPVLDTLLGDADADVRLLVIEVTREWPSAAAVPRLRRVMERDPHVNVCSAAVDVATEVGTSDLLPALNGLRTRFPDEPFLLFAVGIACSRIAASGGRVA